MKKRLLSILMVLCLAVSLVTPVVAVGEEPIEEPVAAIGETPYATLDAAINAANETAEVETIRLLADCTLSPMWGTLENPIVIDGGAVSYTHLTLPTT